MLVRAPVEPGRRQPGREHGPHLRYAPGGGPPGGPPPGVDTDPALDDALAPGTTTPPETPPRPPGRRRPRASLRRSPAPLASAPEQREAARPERLPHHQRGGGDRDRRRIVKVDLLRRQQEGQDPDQANRKGAWVLPMNVQALRVNPSRWVTIQFARSSQTKARTLRLSSTVHPANVSRPSSRADPKTRSRPGSPGRGRGPHPGPRGFDPRGDRVGRMGTTVKCSSTAQRILTVDPGMDVSGSRGDRPNRWGPAEQGVVFDVPDVL